MTTRTHDADTGDLRAARARRGAANRRKGHETERAVARWLRDHGFPGAERGVRTAYTAGGRTVADPGDITGTPCLAWQVKYCEREHIPAWLQETEEQREAAEADYGILVARRSGRTDPGTWWAWIPLHAFASLIACGWDHRLSLTGIGARPCRLELRDVVALLRAAGYGDPPEDVQNGATPVAGALTSERAESV